MEPSCASDRVDPEIFFTVDAWERPDLTPQERHAVNVARLRQAKRVCEFCPLKDVCLDENLLLPYGVVGGLTPVARAELALAEGRTLDRGRGGVDEVVVQRLAMGHNVERVTSRERKAAVRMMLDRGHTYADVMDTLLVSGQTIRRAVESA